MNVQAACGAVLKVEEEFIAVLKEKMPEYMNPAAGDTTATADADTGGLGTISEGAEETEEFRWCFTSTSDELLI